MKSLIIPLAIFFCLILSIKIEAQVTLQDSSGNLMNSILKENNESLLSLRRESYVNPNCLTRKLQSSNFHAVDIETCTYEEFKYLLLNTSLEDPISPRNDRIKEYLVYTGGGALFIGAVGTLVYLINPDNGIEIIPLSIATGAVLGFLAAFLNV